MASDQPLLRILDVNANRASEGLRVVEEYARLVLEDAYLAKLVKELRHDLSCTLASISVNSLLAARDTQHDVGTQIETDQEYRRPSLADVAVANQKRAEQALRCLEEFLKTEHPPVAKQVEQLRYRAYTLAQAIASTARNQTKLGKARLYVLIDGCSSEAEFSTLASGLIGAGVDVLQLRDKRLSDRILLARAHRLRALCANSPTLFIMNDRPDLASLARADGVHVGQEELRVKEVRQIIGTEALVGVSTHSLEQARAAVLDGADYLGCGPTFPSETKSFDQFSGLEFLRGVAAEIRLPAFAIGGISRDNLALVLETGFQRVAVSHAILAARDPAAEARWFRQVVER
jgi:thiamine-phosphate pyrophosphorylase